MNREAHCGTSGASGGKHGALVRTLAAAAAVAACTSFAAPAVAATAAWTAAWTPAWIAVPEFPPARDICLRWYDQPYSYACLNDHGHRHCGCWPVGLRWRARP